jgi:hypothetical protein
MKALHIGMQTWRAPGIRATLLQWCQARTASRDLARRRLRRQPLQQCVDTLRQTLGKAQLADSNMVAHVLRRAMYDGQGAGSACTSSAGAAATWWRLRL